MIKKYNFPKLRYYPIFLLDTEEVPLSVLTFNVTLPDSHIVADLMSFFPLCSKL